MEIKRNNDKVDLSEQSDAELKGCLNDCKEYKAETKAIYEMIHKQGYAADGSETVEEIKEIKEVFGAYCYRMLTQKDSIWL